MTKADKRQIDNLHAARACMSEDVFRGYAARTISAMIRSSRSRKIDELLQLARDLGVRSHPDFIII